MEKIIFFGLVIPILIFMLYLGVSAFKKGFSAKSSKNSEKLEHNNDQLTDEINKLNDLFKSGALTREEFEKAKKKILDD